MSNPEPSILQVRLSKEDKGDRQKMSHSEIESFTTCERRHYYAYGLRGGLRKRVESSALVRGTIGHSLLAEYYEALQEGLEFNDRVKRVGAKLQHWVQQTDLDSYDRLNMLNELWNYIIKPYFNTYREADEEMEVLSVEATYEVPVADDFYMKVIVDAIVRMPNIGIAVWDHKFVYNFYDAAVVDINPQLPKYLAVVRSAGIPASAAFYNELRYRDTKENKADRSLKFERNKVAVTSNRIVTVMEEQLRAAKKIHYLRGLGLEEWERRVLRAANSMICERCPFTEICALDLNGDDKTLAITYNYTTRDQDLNG
jgi:CRISPR/Cas system-associated exonuclease Cas4 (RecB family)